MKTYLVVPEVLLLLSDNDGRLGSLTGRRVWGGGDGGKVKFGDFLYT